MKRVAIIAAAIVAVVIIVLVGRSVPCWADTAWILDVTGELPKAK